MAAPGLPDRINLRRRVGEISDGQGNVPSVIPGWIPLGYIERDVTREVESDEEFIPEYRERVGAGCKIRNCEPLTQELREQARRLSMTPVACRTRAKHASAPTRGAKRKPVKLTKQVSFTEVRDNEDEKNKKRVKALQQESVRSRIPFKESQHTKKAKISQERTEAETEAMDSIDLSDEIARMVKNASSVEELIVVIDQQIAANAVDAMETEPISPAETNVQDVWGQETPTLDTYELPSDEPETDRVAGYVGWQSEPLPIIPPAPPVAINIDAQQIQAIQAAALCQQDS
jgi:hypothetical protein